MRSKSGLTLRLAHYLAEVQRTFYADIYTVYVSNSMSFSTVCRQVRDFSAGVGSVTSAPKYCRSKSASSPKIVIKKLYSKIRRKDILLSRLRTWLAFQKHLHCAFGEIF